MDTELAFLVNNLVIPIAGMLTAIILGGGVLRTVRHYIDRRLAKSEAVSTPQIEELTHRLEELERAAGRVDDIEDRLEFAERLLTRAREPGEARRSPQ